MYSGGDCFAGAWSVVSSLGEPERPHVWVSGFRWPFGYVSLRALRVFAERDAPSSPSPRTSIALHLTTA
jgi:hypothetical protein